MDNKKAVGLMTIRRPLAGVNNKRLTPMHDNVIHLRAKPPTAPLSIELTAPLAIIKSMIDAERDRNLSDGVLLAHGIIVLAATELAVAGGAEFMLKAMTRAAAAAQSQATTD